MIGRYDTGVIKNSVWGSIRDGQHNMASAETLKMQIPLNIQKTDKFSI